MVYDFEEEMKKTISKKKKFNFMVSKSNHFILKDVNPIKKKKHEKTIYYYFKCVMITQDGKKILPGNHTIQLPAKTACLQLYEELKLKGKLNSKNVLITIIKKDNYTWEITVHS